MKLFSSSSQSLRGLHLPSDRRGSVAVEFAVVAPVLVALVIGMIELNRTTDACNLLASAAREGARLATMNRDGVLAEGQSANDKLVSDVKKFLEANGLDPAEVSVSVTHADDPDSEFDLEDPNNELALFEVRVTIDHSNVSHQPVAAEDDYPLSGSVVFRNGVSSVSD